MRKIYFSTYEQNISFQRTTQSDRIKRSLYFFCICHHFVLVACRERQEHYMDTYDFLQCMRTKMSHLHVRLLPHYAGAHRVNFPVIQCDTERKHELDACPLARCQYRHFLSWCDIVHFKGYKIFFYFFGLLCDRSFIRKHLNEFAYSASIGYWGCSL